MGKGCETIVIALYISSSLCFNTSRIRLLSKNSESNYEINSTSVTVWPLECINVTGKYCWLPLCDINESTTFDYEHYYGTIQSLADKLREQSLSDKIAIEMRDSDLPVLPFEIFRGLHFSLLQIQFSNLSDIDAGAFKNVSLLERLVLSNNQLENIPNLSWEEVSISITEIDLSYNRLRSVDSQLQNLTNLRHLNLSHNNIANLASSSFDVLTNLEMLNLGDNHLTELSESIFLHNNKLINLSLSENNLSNVATALKPLSDSLMSLCLSHNPLKTFDRVLSKPSVRLKIFHMNGNKISNFTSTFTSMILNVEKLLMESSQIRFVESNAFHSMTYLQFLSLKNNNIEELDTNIFKNNLQLSVLILRNNRLLDTKFLAHKCSLNYIYLEGNQIKYLNSSGNKLELLEIYLDENPMYRVEENTLSTIGKILLLSMNSCKLNMLAKHVFDSYGTLQDLRMKGNNLTSLNDTLLPLLYLLKLDLSYNNFKNLRTTDFQKSSLLSEINLEGNQLLQVDGLFLNLVNLIELKLQNNNLSYLTASSFSKVKALNVSLEGNPISCDCRLKWLLEKQLDISIDDVVCASPVWLQNDTVKTLSPDNVTIWNEDCANSCKCVCVENDHSYGISLNCFSDTFPTTFPQKTVELIMKNVSLINVPKILTQYNELITLNLANNKITSLEGVSFPPSLEKLDVSNNMLTVLPVAVFDNKSYNISLKKIDLEDNPWKCVCEKDVLDFIKWINSDNMLTNQSEVRCGDTTENGQWKNATLSSFGNSGYCQTPNITVILISAIFTGVVLICAIICVYYRCGHTITVWLYFHGITFVKEEDVDEDKQFDAFVSYSSFDEDFVMYTFLPPIDSKYRLCLHYKHFTVGDYIHDNIFKSIDNSRRTIMLLSRNFLKSEWCHLEFKRAHQNILKDHINRLIVIVLDELPPKEEIDEDINMHITLSTYLKWKDPLFWQRFHYAMRKPRQISKN